MIQETLSTLPQKKYEERIVHVNQMQERALAANCRHMFFAIARGTGKTTLGSIYHVNCVHKMPRSLRLLLSSSYRKIVQDIIPGMMVQWERMGYIRDVHYTIGNSAIPKKMKWESPYYAPPEGYREFLIHWYTGAGYRIGSADRKVTLNGLNLDGIDADELKLIPEDIFNEIIKVNRANPDKPWSHLPEHNSIIGFTDKYWTKKGADWVMKKKALANPKAVEAIIKAQNELDKLTYITDEGEVRYTDVRSANRLNAVLLKMRIETTAFFEAACYVNVPALTPSYIMQMKRNMGENEFRASMLNHDLVRNDVKEYFYPLLSEKEHGYIADNFSKLDSIGFELGGVKQMDCTFDEDLVAHLPIQISVDWGGTISCLIVAQEKGNSINFINSMYDKGGGNIQQLAMRFIEYYKSHRVRKLKFYYDPYGNNTMPNSQETLSEEFARYLRLAGWEVEMMHIGLNNNPRYDLRVMLWSEILTSPREKSRDPKYPLFFMNKNNCKEVFISMLNAEVKRVDRKIKKDKSSEKPGSGVQPELATHFSDAADCIIMHKYSYLLDNDGTPSTLLD